jgi:hypothetical protein
MSLWHDGRLGEGLDSRYHAHITGPRRPRGPKPQWWQRAFAKQLGPEYEASPQGALPRKRLSKQSWEKYVVG